MEWRSEPQQPGTKERCCSPSALHLLTSGSDAWPLLLNPPLPHRCQLRAERDARWELTDMIEYDTACSELRSWNGARNHSSRELRNEASRSNEKKTTVKTIAPSTSSVHMSLQPRRHEYCNFLHILYTYIRMYRTSLSITGP